MSRGRRALVLAAALVSVSTFPLRSAAPTPAPAVSPIARLEAERDAAEQDLARLERDRVRLPEDDAQFADAAEAAWRYVAKHVEPRTGFIAPVSNYPFATIWDIGSMLSALYSAHELGLMDDQTYDARVSTMLGTLERLRLNGDVFGRSYDSRDGTLMLQGSGAADAVGWSAIDTGRLLTWLRIVATRPALAARAAAVVRRINLSRIVHDGYLWGTDLDRFGKAAIYQEGRIGYEQYAARGFALWNARADKALNVLQNALPLSVGGQPLVADMRREDRLTNEPFLLLGLEVGWDRQTRILAHRLVLAQEARDRDTGRLTLTGEDAIALPPHYFYYYCVYSNGRQFAVDVQDRRATVDGPRWISAKSAFALQALMPSPYSARALAQLRPAKDAGGWSSGVYEGTRKSTEAPNINTAAVILTAALVHRVGEPVLAHAQRAEEAARLARAGKS